MDGDELTMDNMRQAKILARIYAKHAGRHRDFDDILQDAYLGLCEAGRKFNPGFGYRFGTYAEKRIKGAIIDGARSRAAWLNATSSRHEAGRACRRVGLRDASNVAADEADPCEAIALWAAVQRLPPRNRMIVILYHYHDVPQRKIAVLLGCSPGRVSQLLQESIVRLRRSLAGAT